MSEFQVTYYRKDGTPFHDTMEWGRLFHDRSYEVIRQTRLRGRQKMVSTVWLGIDHGWGSGLPVIFETMVFGLKDFGPARLYQPPRYQQSSAGALAYRSRSDRRPCGDVPLLVDESRATPSARRHGEAGRGGRIIVTANVPAYYLVNDLVTEAPGILCTTCGRTSFNQNDIRERYCGHCHRFHPELKQAEAGESL